ncbi:MAG TPA: hypothetical protein VF077_13230 [Nitrospiraceae bacterium]
MSRADVEAGVKAGLEAAANRCLDDFDYYDITSLDHFAIAATVPLSDDAKDAEIAILRQNCETLIKCVHKLEQERDDLKQQLDESHLLIESEGERIDDLRMQLAEHQTSAT